MSVDERYVYGDFPGQDSVEKVDRPCLALRRHHVIDGRRRGHVGAFQAVVDVAAEHGQVLGESVPVLGEQVAFDALHQVLEPRGHTALLGSGLRLDQLIAELLEVVFVEEDQPEQRSGHRPLVSAVFKHDDVQHGLQHLLEDFRPHLDDLDQRVVVGNSLTSSDFS